MGWRIVNVTRGSDLYCMGGRFAVHSCMSWCLGALMPWFLHVTAPGTRLGRDSPASNLQLSLLPISLLHVGQGACPKHAGHSSSILFPRQVPQTHAGGSSCGDRWSSTCRPTPHPRFACTSTGVIAARDTSSGAVYHANRSLDPSAFDSAALDGRSAASLCRGWVDD